MDATNTVPVEKSVEVPYDPSKALIKVQGGRSYLRAAARVAWFRSEKPLWGIVTEIVEVNFAEKYAMFRASIFNEEGRLIATATKQEDVKGFADYVEKAETGAVSRALALVGYGAVEDANGTPPAAQKNAGYSSRPQAPTYGTPRTPPPPARTAPTRIPEALAKEKEEDFFAD